MGLVLACIALGSDNYSRAFHGWTSPWIKPLVAVCFLGWLVWSLRGERQGTARAAP